MEFINKHYEKLILMAMLLFFVFAMVNVLSLASKTGEVTDADLRIPTKRPDHEVLARESDEFNTAKIWDSTRLNWLKADFRDKNSELIFYSDREIQFRKISNHNFQDTHQNDEIIFPDLFLNHPNRITTFAR